jgi:hypothetical protein
LAQLVLTPLTLPPFVICFVPAWGLGHPVFLVSLIETAVSFNVVMLQLCADLKLVNLASGLGSASSALPCFLCFWARNDPLQQAKARAEGHMGERAEWAMEFLQPERAAEAALAEARQAVKSHEEERKSRLQGAHGPKGYESRLVELQCHTTLTFISTIP